MNEKILAVVGSTGAQGGGLVRAILADPAAGFRARAITRKPGSEKGRALAVQGAEVVAADLDDRASIARAFEGAYGAFCVTNFWEHFSVEREMAQAQALAQAAQEAGLSHVIWSTLEDTRLKVPLSDDRMPTLQGQYKVPHFDGKGAADRYFRDLPATLLRTSFYWENLISFGMGPKRGPDGKLTFVLPMGDKKLPGIGVEDIGKCAFGIFKRGPELAGTTIGVAGEHLTGADMARELSRALDQEVVYNDVPPEIYRTFPFPGADDIANMFQYKRDFEADYCGARDLAVARSLNPELKTFAEWLSENKHAIPV